MPAQTQPKPTTPITNDPYSPPARFDSHLTKLLDRLDAHSGEMELEDYLKAMERLSQIVLRWIAMQGKTNEPSGSEARRFEAAFAAPNAAGKRREDTGLDGTARDRTGGPDGNGAATDPESSGN